MPSFKHLQIITYNLCAIFLLAVCIFFNNGLNYNYYKLCHYIYIYLSAMCILFCILFSCFFMFFDRKLLLKRFNDVVKNLLALISSVFAPLRFVTTFNIF